MSLMDPANIAKNADDLVAQGLAGQGPLAAHFEDTYDAAGEKVEKDFRFQHKDDPNAKQSPAELKAATDKLLNDDAANMKTALVNAAKGDTNIDINEMAGTANTLSTMFSGGIMGMITGFLSLISNSFIGDYVKAGFSYLLNNPKHESFGELLSEVRMNKGMGNLAKQLQIAPEELQKAFSVDHHAAQDIKIDQPDGNNVNVSYTKTVDGQSTTITETGHFDKDQKIITFDKAHFHTGDNRDGDLPSSQPMTVKVDPSDIDPATGKLRIDDTLKGSVIRQASGLESLIPAGTPGAPGAGQAK